MNYGIYNSVPIETDAGHCKREKWKWKSSAFRMRNL